MDVEEWLDIHRRRRDGVPIRQIARDKSMSRNTVRRALESDTPPGPRTRRSPGSSIDAYEPQIVEMLLQDPAISTAAIGRRIGWTRSHTVLKDHVRDLRAQITPEQHSRPAAYALPAELTSFVGRRTELSELCDMLAYGRLVTLAGPGGVGKTRLAVRAADGMRQRFPDGIWLVQLESLSDPALLAQSLLDALGIADPSRSTGDPVPRLIQDLQGRRALLILDNCEHLVDAVAPLLTTLLQQAPELTVLATSRQLLGVPGEQPVLVPPLPIPASEDSDELVRTLASPAVSLFVDRAAAVLPGFTVTEANQELIARLCRALEGIPLAIELATVRLRVLSPADLLEHLHHRFAVLTEGSPTVPARQRTLEATIAWSFELCTDHERALWARASVFAGGFDIAAATAVCADDRLPVPAILDAISGLVTKSILVREEQGGQVRFRMLETIREFGHAQLAPERVPVLRARHRDWCLGLIDEFLARWFGPDQIAWKQRMRREQANLRAALERALDPVDGDVAAAQRMVGLPWLLWATALSPTEHRRWLHRALEASDELTPERARALVTCGFVAAAQGDLETARAVATEGRALAQTFDIPETRAFATHIVGLVSQFSGQLEEARTHLNEALAEYHALGASDHLVAALETHLGMFHLSCGELDEASTHFQVVHARCEAHGERWARIFATDGLGYIALARGDLDRATVCARDALDLAVAFDDTIGLAFAIELVAWTAAAHDQPGRAAVFLGAASSIWGSFGQQLYGSRFWQQWREVYVAAVSATLGETAFEAAHGHGATLTHAEMARLALDRDQRDTPLVPSPSSLSDREREIVELAAQGQTNREIAEQLYLSHRTVEGHVSRALEKLGLKRRGQLAGWVSEHAVAAGR